MDVRRVLTFHAVARERSFSRAAKALALSQPSVSQQVAALETEPGHRLAGHGAVALADLAEEEWTAPSADGIVAGACRAAGFEPRLTALTSDQLAVRGMVSRGLAVTLVPGLLRDAFSADIVLAPVAGGGPVRDLYALLPEGRRHPLAGRALDTLRAGVDELRV